MPVHLRSIYLDAFVAALHPVYLIAAIVALIGFALTWLMREVPLREGTSRGHDLGNSFAMPRDATSLEALETIVDRISRPEHRWTMIERIARRLDNDLAPDEIWLLIQIGGVDESLPSNTLATPGNTSPETIETIAARLAEMGLAYTTTQGSIAASKKGHATYERLVGDFRTLLAEAVARWAPEEHEEARKMLTELARALVSELPKVRDSR